MIQYFGRIKARPMDYVHRLFLCLQFYDQIGLKFPSFAQPICVSYPYFQSLKHSCVLLTNLYNSIIISPVFMKGARSMKYYVVIRCDMACLAPYTLTR